MNDSALFLGSPGFPIGSFSKDDGDGNENLGKKAVVGLNKVKTELDV